MDSPLLKYLERHQIKLRYVLLIYVGVLLIEKIILGPIMIDAFIRTNHIYSAVYILLSILTLMCGLYGFIRQKRYACIYFLTFFSIEKFTTVIHDFIMMHQNYRMFSTNALKSFIIDVYSGLIVSILIIVFGTLLLYFDFFKEKRAIRNVDVTS